MALSKIVWDLPTDREDGTALAPGELKGTVVSVYDRNGNLVGGQPTLVPAPATEVTFAELGLVDGVYSVEVQSEDSAGLRSAPTGRINFRVGALPAPKSPSNVRIV